MRTAKTRRTLAVVAGTGVMALALVGCTRGGDTPAPTTDPSGDATTAPSVVASPGITDTTLTFGITTPLTGTTAGPGNCTADGAIAYFGYKNANGGITFGDGKTRTIEIKTYDDEYSPEKSLANFQQMIADGVFAGGIGLGTPTNRAWREAAIDAGFPQVLVMTGDPIFSTWDESPWQLGLVAKYQQEGAAMGELLATSSGSHKVAIIAQNDDFGAGYVEGFKEAIADSPNIEIVLEQTYEPTDQTLDGQITAAAASGADVLFNAVSVTPLVIGEVQKAQSLGWFPYWFMPSNTSSPAGVLIPGGAVNDAGEPVYPGMYSVAFSAVAAQPNFAELPNGQLFLDSIAEYTNQEGVPAFPHCVWSWIGAQILEQAFMKMEEPTRESFMAALRDIKGFVPDFMLEGTSIDTTVDGQPAVSSVVVQKFNGRGFVTVDTFE